MPPDIKQLRGLCVVFDEFLPKPEQFVPFSVEIYGRVESEKTILQIKRMCGRQGAGISDTGFSGDNVGDPVVVIGSAAGIRHSHDFIAGQLRQRKAVIFYLVNDFLFRKRRQKRMCTGVCGNFMSGVNVPDFLRSPQLRFPATMNQVVPTVRN